MPEESYINFPSLKIKIIKIDKVHGCMNGVQMEYQLRL